MKQLLYFTSLLTASLGFSQDLFFSEYAEGSSNNKYLEIYNPTNTQIDLSALSLPPLATISAVASTGLAVKVAFTTVPAAIVSVAPS